MQRACVPSKHMKTPGDPMRHLTILMTILLVTALSATASARDVIDHGPFDEVLSSYVNAEGQIDYEGLKKSEGDFAKFQAYVEAVAKADVKGSKKARLAFYLNAYNAMVIHSVINHLPTKSVMKVDGFFKKEKHRVAGKKMTLDHLEHKVIRPTFKDARVHFALVCAAKSCPPLKKKAFTEKNVERMLEKNTKAFIPRATKVDKESRRVTTSQLFNWFKKDFVADEGSVKAYLARYIPEHAEFLAKGEYEVKFSRYDWALNSQ